MSPVTIGRHLLSDLSLVYQLGCHTDKLFHYFSPLMSCKPSPLICSQGVLWSAYTHLISCLSCPFSQIPVLSPQFLFPSVFVENNHIHFNLCSARLNKPLSSIVSCWKKYALCSPHPPCDSQVNLFQFIFICPSDGSQSIAVSPEANLQKHTCSSFTPSHCCLVPCFLLVCILRLVLIFR